MKYVAILFATLFSTGAFAHCDYIQPKGVWQAWVVGVGGGNTNISAGAVRFTEDGKVAADLVGSGEGAPLTPIQIPLSKYNLTWNPTSTVFANGWCEVSGSFKLGPVTNNLSFRYPAGTFPTNIVGLNIVDGAGATLTLRLVKYGKAAQID